MLEHNIYNPAQTAIYLHYKNFTIDYKSYFTLIAKVQTLQNTIEYLEKRLGKAEKTILEKEYFIENLSQDYQHAITQFNRISHQ
ncbi:MAG: hypothetical protein JWM09_423 [Francisellaceae bacterium]|nr:hypothetical protein [Francisellaceae bacterium]